MPPEYIEELHPKQREFCDQNVKKKAARCGRRAGKSRGLAAWFYEGMESHPGESNIYITVTRSKAREVMWTNGLERMRKQYNLPIRITGEDGQLKVRHKNGSSLWLLGVPDKGEIDKVRGGYYWRAAIDEAQAFPDWLGELVEDALEPALMDLNGELAMTGTPGPTSAGYFFEVTEGQRLGWTTHHWTALDNLYLPDAEAYIERKRLELGDNNPTFLREWMGQWCNDPSALIYPFEFPRNAWTQQGDLNYGLPEGEYQYGLGVDLGWDVKSTAFTLLARSVNSGKAYILRSWKRTKLSPQALSAAVLALREEVRRETGMPLVVVVDEGALGGGFTETMRENGIMVEAAEKQKKRAFQEWVRGLITAGLLLASWRHCGELLDECRKLPFDEETGREHESYIRHCCDSMLYIARKMIPHYRPEMELPTPGTKEWEDYQAAEHRKRVVEEAQRKREKKRWR